MKTFYRKGRIIVMDDNAETFPSINAAKRESRRLQKLGHKFVRPS